MSLGSHLAKVIRKNSRAKTRFRQENPSTKGPLTRLHESGNPHNTKICPVCDGIRITAMVDATMARIIKERQDNDARFRAAFAALTDDPQVP